MSICLENAVLLAVVDLMTSLVFVFLSVCCFGHFEDVNFDCIVS